MNWPADMATNLKYTVRTLGKEVVVPINYSFEAGYYVFRAPGYRITVSRPTRTAAYADFEEKLKAAVEAEIRNRL